MRISDWSSDVCSSDLQGSPEGDSQINVYGTLPTDLSGLPDGPKIEGFISARNGNSVQITSVGGTNTVVHVIAATEIRSGGGFLGLSNAKLGADSLLTGLPVTIETVHREGGDRQRVV